MTLAAPTPFGSVASADENAAPTEIIDVRKVFGIDTDMQVKGFAEADAHVPDFDPDYISTATRPWRSLLASFTTAG